MASVQFRQRRPGHFIRLLLLLLRALLFLLATGSSHAFLLQSQPRPPPPPPLSGTRLLQATTTTTTTVPTPSTALPGVFDQESWASLFRSLDQEAYDYDIVEVEGQIPTDLEGTFFNAGPGLFDRGGHSVRSWLDADGQLTAITIRQGKAHIRTKMVATKEYVEERAAGRHLWRGQFGTTKQVRRNSGAAEEERGGAGGKKGGLPFAQLLPTPAFNAFDMQFKNPSNTRPMVWGGRLFSCYETGLPYELDPSSLNTKGEFDFGGMLRSGQPITSSDPRIEQALHDRSGHAFTAHARVDEEKGVLVGWAWRTLLGGLGKANGLEVTFYELDESFHLAAEPVTVQLPACSAPPHDSILTEDYHVFVQYAFNLDLLPCILGLKGPAECLVPISGEKGRTRIHLVPRASGRFAGEPPLTLETPAAFMTHWATACMEQSPEAAADPTWPEGKEDRLVAYAAGWDGEQLLQANADGKLFGELCETSPGPDFSRLPIIRLHRLEVDLRRRRARFALVPEMAATFVDFPKAHPVGGYEMGRKRARHLWMTASNDAGISSPPQGWVHLDLQTGQADSWHAPRPRPPAEQPHVFVSEAVLAPRAPKEGDDPEVAAYLLGMEFDARTGRRSLCVLDAVALEQGPLCKLHLRHALPWGIHNEWTPQVFWDGEAL